MRFKKLFLAGSILVLGMGIFASGADGQSNKNAAGDKTMTRNQLQTRSQIRFMDQDCDGVNDNSRDHANDGIPNGQDPDWAAPKDGSGYQNQNGRRGANGKGNGTGWNNASFRGQGKGLGTGVCDGTGPRGKTGRRGGR